MENKRTLKAVLRSIWHEFYIVFALVLLVFVMYRLAPRLFEPANLKMTILRNIHLLIATVGVSFVIEAGCVDLSVGYQISMISVLIASVMKAGVSPLPAVLIGVVTGMLCGAMNGLLVTSIRLAPFEATLATQLLFHGVSYVISSGLIISGIPTAFRLLTQTSIFGLPTVILTAAMCIVMADLFFEFTYFGRYVRAVGESEPAAEKAGVNTGLVKCVCYIICGAFCALASIVLVSTFGRADSYTGGGIEITSMAAVFLCGTTYPMAKGRSVRYKAWKLIFSVLILVIFEAGVKSVGWNQAFRYIVTAFILVWAFMRSRRPSDRRRRS